MIKFEKAEVTGWEAAIRKMWKPMNSLEKSDSNIGFFYNHSDDPEPEYQVNIGPNDLELMKKLRGTRTDCRRFMQMIIVYVDITAPLYWWKEFEVHTIGSINDFCSIMDIIMNREFELNDFSHEHLDNNVICFQTENADPYEIINYSSIDILENTIKALNFWRKYYLVALDIEPKTGISAKDIWWQMIQLLPSSYNQRRTVMMSYEVLANIYKSRKDHKLDEWRIGFCNWINTLPYSELITGAETEEVKSYADDKEVLTLASNET